MSVNTETAAGVVWGEEVVEADYAGHPGRTYARSPGSLVELLATVGPWDGRDFLVQGDVRIGHRDFLRAIPAAAEMLAARGSPWGSRSAALLQPSRVRAGHLRGMVVGSGPGLRQPLVEHR